MGDSILERAAIFFNELDALPEDEKIEAINQLKLLLHSHSPFLHEPVDCVIWVKSPDVRANDYNPNRFAPPEMKLLITSIREDGFTQPIVTYHEDSMNVVVDGFHRNRVGRETVDIRNRLKGYLPITRINADRQDRGDRIAATIRHNRARGRHNVEAMSQIVLELSRRNWSDTRIAKELGMDDDEVLRLKQISGLAELFANEEFSEAWEAESL